jgi:hypothetical protein
MRPSITLIVRQADAAFLVLIQGELVKRAANQCGYATKEEASLLAGETV